MTLQSYESISDHIIALLREWGALPECVSPTPWDGFVRLSTLIHETYEVPSTTFTPMMRRLLFAIGCAAKPRNIVGVGTYVGYTFSWLLRNRLDSQTGSHFEKAIGIDIDPNAVCTARRNCIALNHDEHLTFLEGDGICLLKDVGGPIDLLYIDLDNPVTGKAGYTQVLRSALPYLQPGALILAHDSCEKVFANDFNVYHAFVRDSSVFSGPWNFPVDACGLSVCCVR